MSNPECVKIFDAEDEAYDKGYKKGWEDRTTSTNISCHDIYNVGFDDGYRKGWANGYANVDEYNEGIEP